jgi:methyl-accepting chemotaxis protein
LLSEAAHAGAAGRGFVVAAGEVGFNAIQDHKRCIEEDKRLIDKIPASTGEVLWETLIDIEIKIA